MDKDEIASYLVSLHTLLEAQSKGVGAVPSTILADEYSKYWALLKSTIQEENENGQGNLNESRAYPTPDQPGRRI